MKTSSASKFFLRNSEAFPPTSYCRAKPIFYIRQHHKKAATLTPVFAHLCNRLSVTNKRFCHASTRYAFFEGQRRRENLRSCYHNIRGVVRNAKRFRAYERTHRGCVEDHKPKNGLRLGLRNTEGILGEFPGGYFCGWSSTCRNPLAAFKKLSDAQEGRS